MGFRFLRIISTKHDGVVVFYCFLFSLSLFYLCFSNLKKYIYLVRPIFLTLDKALIDCTSRGQSRGRTCFLRSDGGAEEILSLHHGLKCKSLTKMRKK